MTEQTTLTMKDKVLVILQDNQGAWIPAQAFIHLGWSFRNRISELHKSGYDIESRRQLGSPCFEYRLNRTETPPKRVETVEVGNCANRQLKLL